MAITDGDALITAGVGTVEPNKPVPLPAHENINEKVRGSLDDIKDLKDEEPTTTLQTLPFEGSSDAEGHDDAIVVTGADAALHLLPLRDDGDAALTFRSLLLATALSAFQAVMTQIYSFKPTQVTISGTFIVLIAYFAGNAWANFLPRGDRLEARWRARGGEGSLPTWLRIVYFINPGPWGLKEHAICAITATSASNAAASITVFTAQKLFYDLPLSAATVILSTLSIGLFGYGLCGLFRPITVFHSESVYWSNLPTVKTLQGLHWQSVKGSKPIRFFWYAYASMFCYEFFPAYIFPWLNSVSIPCLASMNASGSKAEVLTNLFGGATNNEGLGLFSLSFDWQYANSAIGYGVCFIVMLAIYYGNAWGSRALPFMSTSLRSASGGKYPVSKVFVDGVLDESALQRYGLPQLTGTFAYAIFMALAAIGALIAHVILFWGKDIWNAFKSSTKENKNFDRHHIQMAERYKEAPWWWYASVLVISFVLGLVVVIKEHITLPVWAYVLSLILGIVIAPFSTILYARFGNGIATNNLSKMIAGLVLPGRPIGGMYFASWSHNVIANALNLSGDLKMGEYLKIPPRVMFLTQIWGTVFGGFINYVLMVSIVNNNRDLLVNSNGDSAWSGATIQAYNTNAAAWSLAKYLYASDGRYSIVPYGLLIGAGIVLVHWIVVKFVPKIRNFSLTDINFAQFIQYSGFIPYNQSQTCVIFSQILAGLFVQFYLRNYRPRIFKDYSYLVTGAWDGASLTCLFILSFAVFGAGGPSVPFPQWWGNNQNGNLDLCPTSD